MSSNLTELLGQLHAAKDAYQDAKKAADEAKAHADALQAEVFAAMQDAGILTVKTENATYSARQTAYAQVQDREQFHQFVRENGLEEELLRTREESARLNEMVRNALDTGEELPPGLGWYPREFISITSQ